MSIRDRSVWFLFITQIFQRKGIKALVELSYALNFPQILFRTLILCCWEVISKVCWEIISLWRSVERQFCSCRWDLGRCDWFFFFNKTLSFTGHCYWYFIQLFIHALTTSFSTLKYCIDLLQFEFLMKHDLKDELLAGITRFWRECVTVTKCTTSITCRRWYPLWSCAKAKRIDGK